MLSDRKLRLAVISGLILIEADGVRRPDEYSEFLAEQITACHGLDTLDLTCGAGFHAMVMGQTARSVVAVDISAEAVALTRRNVAVNALPARFDYRVGDLFAAVDETELFDLIVAWPPVMPVPPRIVCLVEAMSLANDGGPTGRGVLDRILTAASAHLGHNGLLRILHPWYLDLAETTAVASSGGLDTIVGPTRRFPLGVISRERLDYLRTLGRHPVLDDGIFLQEMTIVDFRRTSSGE